MLSKLKLKYIQSLGHKKFRDEENVFIAEGPRIVKELLTNERLWITELFGTAEWVEENRQRLVGKNVTVILETELEKISQLKTPNQVIAIVQRPANQLPSANEGIIIALDGLQDP